MSQNRTLHMKIFPFYLLIIFLSLMCASWYALSSAKHFFLKNTTADLTARGHLILAQMKPFLSGEVVHGEGRRINEMCRASGKISSTRITVILPSGKVIGDSNEDPAKMENHKNRPEVIKALGGNIASFTRFSETLDQEMMYVAIPIMNQHIVRAVVRTSLPVTDIYMELKNIQVKILLGGILISILAAIISHRLSRRIAAPLELMKQGAEKFASGDLSHKLYEPETLEMKSLAKAMNQMASRLDDRIRVAMNRKNELESVLSSMVEGVVAIDNNQVIISVNRAASMILGGESTDFRRKTIQETVRNLELQRFIKKAQESKVPLEEDIVLHQDDRKILHLHSNPIDDSKGTLIIINDVTRLRNLENMRKDFAANVSHEIRTPLTAIKGFVETLQGDDPAGDPENLKRFLGIIDKNVTRLMNIIEDLMRLSRIERQDEMEEIHLTETPVLGVLEASVANRRDNIDLKKIDVKIICDKDIHARIDSRLFEQAMVNLVDNAVKYCDEEGKIVISVDSDADGPVISVSDNGPGIPREHHDRLFERFYRVDKGRTRSMGGTGLGLSIVKHIVQVHGGHVDVESTPGKGSTFQIHLPA